MTEEKKDNQRNQRYTAEEKEAIREMGAKLKAFRNALGLTRQDMAKQVSLSISYLQGLENGLYSLSAITAVAYYRLGFNINSLGDDDQPLMREAQEKKELVLDTRAIAQKQNDLFQIIVEQQRWNKIHKEAMRSQQEEINELKKMVELLSRQHA